MKFELRFPYYGRKGLRYTRRRYFCENCKKRHTYYELPKSKFKALVKRLQELNRKLKKDRII